VLFVIQPSNVFKDNLAQMPAIDGIERIDLVAGKGEVAASIENKPGKQGSLASPTTQPQTRCFPK